MSLIIAPFELMPNMPSGGIFANNAASTIPGGYGIFSGNPGMKTSEQLYMSAQGDAQASGPPPVSMAPVPAASNFGAIAFPIRYYDPNLDYGNPVQVIQGGLRGP